MMTLKEAVKQTRANRAKRRQLVIDAMAPIKKVLLEYKRDLVVNDLGIRPDKKQLGHYVNSVAFDVGSGPVVASVASHAPGAIFIQFKNEECAFVSLEEALLHLAELIVE